MPFELGLFFGAKRFGSIEQRTKIALVFEKTKYSYMQCISDLNGIDAKAHNIDPMVAIKNVRDWLSTASKRTNLPNYRAIQNEYAQFLANFSKTITKVGIDISDIPFIDFCAIVQERISKIPGMQTIRFGMN
jgi:hypothetical protein